MSTEKSAASNQSTSTSSMTSVRGLRCLQPFTRLVNGGMESFFRRSVNNVHFSQVSSVQCPVPAAGSRMSNVECLGHRMAPTNRMKCAALKGRVTPSTSINVLLAMWVSSRRLPGSPQSNMDAYKDMNALIGHSVTLSWSHTVNLVLVSLFLFLFLFLLSFSFYLAPLPTVLRPHLNHCKF